jgi:hypothetical protein
MHAFTTTSLQILGVLLASYPVGTGGYFPWVKANVASGYVSSPLRNEVKNESSP